MKLYFSRITSLFFTFVLMLSFLLTYPATAFAYIPTEDGGGSRNERAEKSDKGSLSEHASRAANDFKTGATDAAKVIGIPGSKTQAQAAAGVIAGSGIAKVIRGCRNCHE